MNEHGFIRSIHRLIPRHVYVWKVNDNYQGGVADAYYSGNSGDLWIEYKYVKALPKRPNTEVKIELTGQQRLWLNSRYGEGRRVAVVVGSPNGSIILTDRRWNEPITAAEFMSSAVEKGAVADYIVRHTTHQTGSTNDQPRDHVARSCERCASQSYMGRPQKPPETHPNVRR